MTFEEKVQYWFAAVSETAAAAQTSEKSADKENLLTEEAAIRRTLLWRLHACTYLRVFVSDGEVYENWDTCGKIAEEVRNRCLQEAGYSLSENERETFLHAGAERLRDPEEFQKLLQETCAGSAEDVTGGMDFLRFHLYRRQEERKAAVLAPYSQEDGEEVPEAMDEFEYTDWKIAHSSPSR